MDYHNWIEEQEKYYNCKLYNKTNGSKTSNRKTKNEEYLRNGSTPPPPDHKRSREKLGYIFNERFVYQRAGPPRGETSFCCRIYCLC
ncbi:hypothetical protein BDC45DRAFT_497844 [Circinella umbellata]|nr:hypothetical protein BDC45DRAFT_497844 [Circinella umbellata]